jgi:hypothetical protein
MPVPDPMKHIRRKRSPKKVMKDRVCTGAEQKKNDNCAEPNRALYFAGPSTRTSLAPILLESVELSSVEREAIE